MGSVKIPVTAHYGAQTQRAVDNFPVSGLSMPWRFIESVILIKESAAAVNSRLDLLDADIAKAIEKAARSLRERPQPEQFPVDVFQTGSGTSTNMNVNEVIAHIASKASGLAVHPNDHVNMGQSSNDVIPTAIHIAAATALNNSLLPSLEHLANTIDKKAGELQDAVKMGRTHLMDAMPLTLAQELSGWSAQIRSNIERIRGVLPRLYALAQGGTAVGTGVNAHPKFAKAFITSLSKLTHLPFQNCNNTFEAISSQDTAVELSGQLKTLAVSMMKIANDLRWMNSGPLTGLGEIELEALQPGSSIMPGKVNPVIPESVAMVCAKIMGNDTTITVAGQSGNFQLNVMLPVIAYTLLESIEILSNAAKVLADRAVSGFKVNDAHLQAALAKNPILVTALNPIIGYQKAAAIAKKAYKEQRPILDVADEMTDIGRNELERVLNPNSLT
jgi:fumarate hydratase class II